MYYDSKDIIPMSTVYQVVGLTDGPNRVSLGAALHREGISLEMLDCDETAQYTLLAELNWEDSRRLQWWLDDFRNTGISIL